METLSQAPAPPEQSAPLSPKRLYDQDTRAILDLAREAPGGVDNPEITELMTDARNDLMGRLGLSATDAQVEVTSVDDGDVVKSDRPIVLRDANRNRKPKTFQASSYGNGGKAHFRTGS